MFDQSQNYADSKAYLSDLLFASLKKFSLALKVTFKELLVVSMSINIILNPAIGEELIPWKTFLEIHVQCDIKTVQSSRRQIIDYTNVLLYLEDKIWQFLWKVKLSAAAIQ